MPLEKVTGRKPRPRTSFRNYVVALEPETGFVVLAMILIMILMFPEWRGPLLIAFFVAFVYFGGIFSGGGARGELGEEVEPEEEEERREPRLDDRGTPI